MRTQRERDILRLDAQLGVTEKAHRDFGNENEKLKEIFRDCFDENIIVSFLKYVNKVGGESEKVYAMKFKEAYDGDNFDDVNVKWFKNTYRRYNEQFLNELNGEGEK